MKRDALFAAPLAALQGGFVASVVSLDDPEGLHRVQLRLAAFDAVAQQDAPLWARVAAPFAGADRGAFWLPEVGDEVLVVFLQGDARLPVVVGGLWNGASAPPATIQGGGVNRYKHLQSKNGIQLVMDDQPGQEKLHLQTPGGQKFTLKDGPGAVTIEDSNGNRVTLDGAGVTIEAAAKVKVQAAQVEVSAGMVKVDAAMVDCSGIVKCQVLQATAVISSSYTPGAGNVW